MDSDWKRAFDNLTINYNKYWPTSTSLEKQQEYRYPAVKKKGYFASIGDVWKTPTIRNNYGVNQIYSNQFQQTLAENQKCCPGIHMFQITPDCGLELDLSSIYRNGNKSETDLTKIEDSTQARNKGSYKMLIQQLEELSMMKHEKFRKLCSPEPDSEEETKKNSTNHQTKQVSVNKSRGYSREGPGKHQREILIISDQEKFKHLSNSLTTSEPHRRVDDLSGLHFKEPTPNTDQREILLENDCYKVESKPIDNFRYSSGPINIKRNNQNFFLPFWILKPAENKTNELGIDQSETFPLNCFQQPCLDFSPEFGEVDNPPSSGNHEEEGNLYPYPDFLPPPFNRIDFSELSMLENYKWKDALPARPNRLLEQLIDRIVQMEKIQFMTIQKEKSRITGMMPSTAANTSSSRKNTKRSRKSRQCDRLCVQPPRVEVCFKKANPAKRDKRKYLYRLSSSHSCNESQDFQLSNEDVKFKRRLRANCNAYKHFKRSMYSSNQIILSRTASNYANTQAFAAVKSVKPLPGQKSSSSSPCKYKKKQKYIQAALGKAVEGRAKHCFLSRTIH